MAQAQLRAKKAVRVQARIKVWLEADGRYVFGFGLSEILKAVEAAGSIKEAAQRLGKSYRYVWGRIKKAESTLGQSLVDARVGGKDSHRSGITELARRLVTDYDALRQRMFDVAEEEFGHRFSRLPPL
jgi:molybdate transport system regulatory protein